MNPGCTMKEVNGHVFECCKDQLCNVDQTGNRVSCITEVLEDICGKVSGKGREEEDSVAGQITVLISTVDCHFVYSHKNFEAQKAEQKDEKDS